MRFRVLAMILLLAAAFGRAEAHSLWIERDGDSLVLRSGHLRPGEAPDLHDYEAGFVLEALCFDESGAADTLEALDGVPFRAPGSCAALAIFASSGYWTKTPRGTKNLPKDEVETPIRSGLYYSFLKRFERWDPALACPLTSGLEIVPLEDPTALRAGDSLDGAVYWNGEPAAGADVYAEGEKIGVTGEDGRFTAPVALAGIRIVTAVLIEPVESEKTDRIVRSAALTIEAGETP